MESFLLMLSNDVGLLAIDGIDSQWLSWFQGEVKRIDIHSFEIQVVWKENISRCAHLVVSFQFLNCKLNHTILERSMGKKITNGKFIQLRRPQDHFCHALEDFQPNHRLQTHRGEENQPNQVANVFAELKENWSDTKVATIFEIEKNIKSRKWESNNDSDEGASFPNDGERAELVAASFKSRS